MQSCLYPPSPPPFPLMHLGACRDLGGSYRAELGDHVGAATPSTEGSVLARSEMYFHFVLKKTPGWGLKRSAETLGNRTVGLDSTGWRSRWDF